jgi:hypothetical protein
MIEKVGERIAMVKDSIRFDGRDAAISETVRSVLDEAKGRQYE